MPLVAGTRLGPYLVAGLLGSGGMGEVYRARDTKLHRDVAIKVLPDFASDPDQRARFDREAQLLAALNDPHIAQIYGVEDVPPSSPADPVLRAIVMELVEGPTLADRIAGGAIPLDEALPLARQIAEGLESAHARGIMHRDLKPANIKVTAAGVVKLLDFGLARSFQPVGALRPAGAAGSGPSAPTLALPTHSGMILGTAAYMAPEQARGERLDKRADLWAFGVVLYEMLSGRRPFDGATLSDTIAAVLRQDVDWTALPAGTPEDVRRLLRRCLERDPKERLHDAADIRLLIADVRQDAATPGPGGSRTTRGWIVAGVVGVAAAIAGALAGPWLFRPPSPGAPGASIVRLAIEPPREVETISNVTTSADGRFVVYEGQIEGQSRLFLRRVDALESRALAATEGAHWPFVSPDGAWIGFFRDGRIYKVSTDGGDALALCDVRGGPGAAWGRDGRIIFSRTWLSGLSIVPADGGTPAILTRPDASRQEIGHWWPSLLPDGQVLFTIVMAGMGLNDARIGLLNPATGTYRVLFPGARAWWLPSGHIVFYRTGRYLAIRFDAATSSVTGEPFPVLEDAQELDPSGDWPQPVAVSPGGTLVYLAGPYVPPSRLTWIDSTGHLAPLSFAARPFVSVKLSPDGRRVATASLESGRLLIRLFDLQRGTEDTPVIAGMNFNPVWLPDGRLSFTSMRKGDFDVYVKDVGGIAAEQPVLTGPDDTDPVAWTRDGRLIFQGSEPDGRYPLKVVDPRHAAAVTRLTEQHVENGGSLSPDERWLAYQSAENGRTTLYVRALDGAAPGVPLSRSTGEFPVFLRDGRTLAFLRAGQLIVLPWRELAGRFEPGSERVVAPLAFGSGWTYGAPYDVAGDGRFLALVRTDPPGPVRIRVVIGWDRDVVRLGQRDPR